MNARRQEELTGTERALALRLLDMPTATAVLDRLGPRVQRALVPALPGPETSDILTQLPADAPATIGRIADVTPPVMMPLDDAAQAACVLQGHDLGDVPVADTDRRLAGALVMEMGGNVDVRSTTILTRDPALGDIALSRCARHLRREVSIGRSRTTLIGLTDATFATSGRARPTLSLSWVSPLVWRWPFPSPSRRSSSSSRRGCWSSGAWTTAPAQTPSSSPARTPPA